MSNFPYLVNEDVLTVFLSNGDSFQVERANAAFHEVVVALNDSVTTDDELRGLLDRVTALNEALHGEAAVVGDALVWNGNEIHGVLADRILDIVTLGLEVDPWLRFVENVYANPSFASQEELYLFLERHDLPITEDGHFLAYKKVTGDYKDCRTRSIDNSVGAIPEMPRERVDNDRRNTCSVGLHFCSQEYLRSFGGERLIIVKINPMDVVSIPSDFNNAKGRTWRYEVVGEIKEEEVEKIEWPPVMTNPPENENEEDEDLDDPEDEAPEASYVAQEFFDWLDDQEDSGPDMAPVVPPPAAPTPRDRTESRSRRIWRRLRGGT